MGGNHKLDGSVRCHLYAFRFPVAYGFGASDFAGCGSFRFVIVGTDADWGEVGGFAQLAHFTPASGAFQSIYGCAADVKPLEVAGCAFYSYGFLNFLWADGRAVCQIVDLELLTAVTGKAYCQLAAVCADGREAVGGVTAAAGAGDRDAVSILAVAAQGCTGAEGKTGDSGCTLAAAGGVAAGPEPGDSVHGNAIQVCSVAELFQGHIVYGIFPKSFVFYAGEPQVIFMFSGIGQLGKVIIICIVMGVTLRQPCRSEPGGRITQRQVAAGVLCRGGRCDFAPQSWRQFLHFNVLLFLHCGDGFCLRLEGRRRRRAKHRRGHYSRCQTDNRHADGCRQFFYSFIPHFPDNSP